MRICNDNFIVKRSEALYARDMPYHFSDSLTVQFTTEFLYSIFVIAFLPELMAGKSLDTPISRAKLFAVIAVSREKERRARLYASLPSIPGRVFRTLGRKRNISLGVISRARHAIGGMSFRLRIYQHTRGV